jgi:nicotinic acetylcholine receptor
LLYNSADDSFDSTSKVNAVIESNGGVSYIPPGMFKSTCVIKVEDFPFDEQVCALKFGRYNIKL